MTCVSSEACAHPYVHTHISMKASNVNELISMRTDRIVNHVIDGKLPEEAICVTRASVHDLISLIARGLRPEANVRVGIRS